MRRCPWRRRFFLNFVEFIIVYLIFPG